MVIAITGSRGFVGSHLVARLKEIGYEFIEIDTKTGFDVTKKDDLKKINKFDCLIHLAGKVSLTESFILPYEYLTVNYLSTLNVLELCKKYSAKLIFASSNVYGNPVYLPIDESHRLNVTNPYTQSKIIGEQLCQLYCNCFNISCISLRQFNIYGSKMNENSLIPTILKQAPSGLVKVKDARPRRDYVYIDDVIEAYISSIKYDAKGFEVFNIASGVSSSVKDIVKICENKLSNNIQLIDLGQSRKNEILNIEVNINKAKMKLGWEPKFNLIEGIIGLMKPIYQQENPGVIFSSSSKTKNNYQDYIHLSVPSFTANEWKYVKECLDTEWVSTAGEFIDQFEQKIAEYTHSKYAIACINGTSALHMSLLIAGVQAEDEVIVPTLTFIAPVNTIRYCSAYPVFMDADQYYNIDVAKTIDFILKETETKSIKIDGQVFEYTFNKVTGRRISAIIPIHVFGNAVWLDDLFQICKQRNIKIIEDATESLGTWFNRGDFNGRHTGTIGDIGCLSFNGNKIITTGGGGMILTDNEKYATKAKYLTTQAKDDNIRFIHNSIGYNYRLTNILAALGIAQFERLQDYLKIKMNNYYYYKKHIDKINGLYLAEVPQYANNNYWMYALQIDKDVYGKDRDHLLGYLEKNNIQVRPVWYLNHMQKEYRNYQCYSVENAQKLHTITLNIPCSVNLNQNMINKVIEKLNER